MSRPSYVITTCGNRKSPVPAPAAEFYQGSFVRQQGKAAYAMKPKYGRIILSNKYGYMRPDFIIPGPYDSHWGYPDTMPDNLLLAQIKELIKPLKPGDYVVNLGAKEYARQTRRLFPEWVKVYWLPKHLPHRRMGYQGQFMRALQVTGRVPAICLEKCEFTFAEV